jgi:hypothetical protein
MSCTECGRKGGCDAHKGEMFAALDEALARLYPTRRWGEPDEAAAFGAGLGAGEGEALAAALAGRLKAATLFRPGAPDETCDYVYVLCVGRPPSLVELREGALAVDDAAALSAGIAESPVEEVYLRVALSTLARFAAVQEVAVSAHAQGTDIVVTEAPRAGVFAPPLLPRLRTLVAVLAERGVRHLDFGEIIEAPAGFDAGDYPAHWGGAPAIANYLFYPQAPATISTTAFSLEEPSS